MRMESFISSISEFFKMKRNSGPDFEQERTRYVIPKYQREYKWNSERVSTLFSDINNRDKFLGNIILNKVSNYYEIVDGQQRITTIMLILLALFNLSKKTEGTKKSEEQEAILGYLKRNERLVLENESIGEYLQEEDNTIKIVIKEEDDIYYQKNTFEKLYTEIIDKVNKLDDIISFQKKVLDCKVLVLIGDTEGMQNDSIEEVFLDINFKSQLLDVADIFKGYCFKNYISDNHEELKQLWTEIRKCTKDFERFGYEEREDNCEFLYHYLLSKPDGHDITKNLSPKGKHYLDGKNNTQTKELLQDMISYGKHIIAFSDNLSIDTYAFVDICSDAKKHSTEIHNLRILKQMAQRILCYSKAQYYKFPFFMLIHYLQKNKKLKEQIQFEDIKKIVTNYYVYSFLFINDSKSKSKESIDRTIFNELYNEKEDVSLKIKNIVFAVKGLRSNLLSKYGQFTKMDTENAYILYSLIDNYNPVSNFLEEIYTLPDYNKEHLLVHKNIKMNIDWNEDNNRFTFSLRDTLGKPNGKVYIANSYKNLTSNYLILPEALNRTLGQFDIIEKTKLIKEYYNKKIPAHISIFLEHIEKNDKYKRLLSLKGSKESENKIKSHYKDFIEDYFSNEQQRILYEELETALKDAFKNKQ